ncbi:MAG: peptidoglycan-associated lipoprotein Pal [Proteobacteria bacterium]|nr:peptidoglycan-associated lipoprotein Pal [Pseudomonadota bacterium]
MLLCCTFAFVQCTTDDETEVSEVVDGTALSTDDLDTDPVDPGGFVDPAPEEETAEEDLSSFSGGEDVEMYAGPSPVYFALDNYQVNAESEIELGKLATYLKDNPLAMLQIEGHCDDRGTVEYNLALGERRALSVKNFLVNLGVEDNRLSTISFGEERPAIIGNDEFAWSQNRRVEFVIQQN